MNRTVDVEAYEVPKVQRRLMQVVTAAFAVGGISGVVSSLVNGTPGSALFLVAWTAIVVSFPGRLAYWLPFRAELDADGVTLVATLRRVRVGWGDLASVSPPALDLARTTLRWRRRDGTKVVTPGNFRDVHRLLTSVERLAPSAEVTS